MLHATLGNMVVYFHVRLSERHNISCSLHLRLTTRRFNTSPYFKFANIEQDSYHTCEYESIYVCELYQYKFVKLSSDGPLAESNKQSVSLNMFFFLNIIQQIFINLQKVIMFH
jgi:hypothetical protein